MPPKVRSLDLDRLIAYRGEVRTLAAWAAARGLTPDELYARIYRFGWKRSRAMEEAGPDVGPTARFAFEGRTLVLSEWAAEAGLPVTALRWRVDNWKDFGRALRTPLGRRGRPRKVVRAPGPLPRAPLA